MQKMDQATRSYLASIGRKGGLKSRRELAASDARRMVLARETRRAYRDFHARCFWSSPPGYVPAAEDVEWVVSQLRKHGGAAGWNRASRICRYLNFKLAS